MDFQKLPYARCNLTSCKTVVKQSNYWKSYRRKGSAEGNTVVVADQKKLGIWKFFLVTNMWQ